MPDKFAVGPEMNLKEEASLIFQKPGKVTLGPGDSCTGTTEMQMGCDNIEDAQKNKEHLISDKSEGVVIQFSVNYSNELDESQKYRTFELNRIHNKEAQIIKSEMLILHKKESQKDITIQSGGLNSPPQASR